MSSRSVVSLAALIAFAVPALLPAQTAESSASEDERLEALARASAEWYVPQTTLMVGFRVLGSGATVNFRQLGNISYTRTATSYKEGAVDRAYDNGQVLRDAVRSDESNLDGSQTSTPGGRYATYVTVPQDVKDANGNVIGTEQVTKQVGDFISYTPGLTRSWSFQSPEQTAMAGYMAFSNYSAAASSGNMTNKQGPSGGVDFQLGRSFNRAASRFQWGWIAGISLNDINSKTAGSVLANLKITTDYYSLNGLAAPTTPAVWPSFTGKLKDANGLDIIDTQSEVTVPISSVPDATLSGKENTVPDGTTVTGRWQVKGSYFMVRLGPSLRSQLTEHLGVSASLGLAGAFAGTRYTAHESMPIPNVTDGTLTADEVSDTTKFLGGYFADLSLDWAANERTGLFGGVTAQKFDDYTQTVGGRTARVDLGSAVGLRGGITIKF